MNTPSDHHMTVNDEGFGLCSVAMFSGGAPDGFCDKVAYGPCIDHFKYRGYVPGLACYRHGGPSYNIVKRLQANVREYGT